MIFINGIKNSLKTKRGNEMTKKIDKTIEKLENELQEVKKHFKKKI
ncbi:MAG: hypothetical protein Q7J16_10785 [Candidatus Cloacimonadales bacterium]|nr:hypothetical protein [Candidatus Cloacimonadales bacterium]